MSLKKDLFEFHAEQSAQELYSVACLFQSIVSNTDEGIVVFDESNCILYVNQEAERFLGRSAEQLLGTRLEEILSERNLKQIRDLCESCREHQIKICTTVGLDIKNVPSRYFEVCISCDSCDEEPLLQLYIRDRTALKHALDELKKRNAFFNRLISSSVDGIIAADMAGKIILFNKGAQSMLGYTESEAVNTLHVSRLYPRGEANNIMQKLRSKEYGGLGKCYKHRLIGMTKDGTRIPLSLSGAIIYDEEGREIATVGIFTDMRQFEKMQRDLESKQMELIQVERMASLGKLAAGVAHEINNPLTGILTFAEDLMEEAEIDDPRMEDYQLIYRETMRCREIVRDLLGFAKQDIPQKRTIQVNQIILQTFSLVKRLASFHNCEITHKLDTKLPLVNGDPNQLQQVFLNMMINASEAMSQGGELFIASRLTESNREIEVSFSDTGEGIPPETLKQIFEPFFSTKGGKTNGLGLAVSYGIIQQHDGHIEVETALGQGTTFHIFLPTLPPDRAEDSQA